MDHARKETPHSRRYDGLWIEFLCQQKYKVGDRIQITLNNKIVKATTTAIVQRTDDLRLQVAYGRDLTATAEAVGRPRNLWFHTRG